MQAIMRGNGSMDAKHDGPRLPRQVRYSKRPRPPFNLNLGHIHWIRHFGPFIPSRGYWIKGCSSSPEPHIFVGDDRLLLTSRDDELVGGCGECLDKIVFNWSLRNDVTSTEDFRLEIFN